MLQAISAGICKGKNKAQLVPYCNTGRLNEVPGVTLISLRPDLVKLSIHGGALIAAGFLNPHAFAEALFIRAARRQAFIGTNKNTISLTTKDKTEGLGLHGFTHAAVLTYGKGVLARLDWGGSSQLGWCTLQINGGLCKYLKPSHYRGLYALARRLNARLGAIDLAGDDQHGKLGIHPLQVRQAHAEDDRAFLPGHLVKGQAPRMHRWYEENNSCTLYLGGQRSAIRHRIYEKGKEQGDQRHLSWHRWEVMFRRTDKTEISMQLLRPGKWAQAWLGSCKYLEQKFEKSGAQMVNKTEKIRRTNQQKAAKAVLQLERQYGGVIAHLIRILGADGFLEAVQRPSIGSPLADLTSEDAGDIYQLIAEDRIGADKPGLKALQHVQKLWADRDENKIVVPDDRWYEDNVCVGNSPWYRLGLLEECLGEFTEVDLVAAAAYAGLKLKKDRDIFDDWWFFAQPS